MYPDARLDIATGTPADYQAMKLGSNVGVRHKPMLSRGATDPVRFIRRLWQIRSDRLAGGARDEFDSYFRGADLVVFQGGPAWNDVFLHGGKIKEMLLRMQACQSAGAMVVLWGQSFGPFAWRGLGGLVKRRLIKQALNRVNLIAARDLFSLPALARIGVKRPTMIRAADAATRLRVSDEARAESLRHWSDAGLSPTATTLGVCLRDLRNRYGLTDETFETFCDQIAVGLDRAVDDFEQLVFCSTDYRHGRKLCSDLEVFRASCRQDASSRSGPRGAGKNSRRCVGSVLRQMQRAAGRSVASGHLRRRSRDPGGNPGLFRQMLRFCQTGWARGVVRRT